MKILCAAVVVATMFVNVLTCPAQATAFPIKLTSGVVTLDQSDVTTSISFGRRWLVGEGNRLVLVVDQDNHELRLDSVDLTTNLVETLATSTRVAILANGAFGGDLQFTALTVSNGLFDITGDGSIQVRGHIASDSEGNPINASGHFLGVLNDSVSGNTDAGDFLIRAKIVPAGQAFDATEFNL